MLLDALPIPAKKLKKLQDRGMETVYDLATNFPKTYHDFRSPVPVSKLVDNAFQCVTGRIIKSGLYGGGMVQFIIKDDGGEILKVSFFHMSHMIKKYKVGDFVFSGGKAKLDPKYGWTMQNPIVFETIKDRLFRIVPVYKKIPGLSVAYLEETIQSAVELLSHTETIEKDVMLKYGLSSRKNAFRGIHTPKDMADVERSKRRVSFDYLFDHALQMESFERMTDKSSPIVVKRFTEASKVMKALPFDLTTGQSEVLRNISKKMMSGTRVEALIQGDVGCGKTIVAVLLMITMADNGFQSVLMAPTNVLGKQHYEDLQEKLADTPYEVAYLSGDTKAREKKKILKGIKEGTIHMVVGTHAVIQEDVVFEKLGLTVVDEEHRFGVVQRNQLKMKSKMGVHHVNMSATPIPRSLALSMYGNAVDVHTIKQMPKGRKPVKTAWLNDAARAQNGMLQQIQQGHQVYVVCPLIEESDSELLEGVKSIAETAAELQKRFSHSPEVKIGVISGDMKPAEIQETLDAYTRNELNLLISTTIIEVGVNVPNATLIVIQNAERFGLAQLHQLRGRVGRSDLPSYCVLLSNKDESDRLEAMVASTDGFKIAKRDMEIRGTGDLIGTKQSGQNMHVELIMQDPRLYVSIQEEVSEIFDTPKRLNFYRQQQMLSFEEELVNA